MESRTAGDTLRVAVPLIEPEVAVIVAVPVAIAALAPALLVVATLDAEVVQTAEAVRSCVLASL